VVADPVDGAADAAGCGGDVGADQVITWRGIGAAASRSRLAMSDRGQAWAAALQLRITNIMSTQSVII
jgi:hypothetical protein